MGINLKPRTSLLGRLRHAAGRRSPTRPRIEALERRSLLAVYLPAQANYTGTGVTNLAVLRYNDNFTTVPDASTTLLVQPTPTATAAQSIGYGLGISGVDVPVSADFDGDGKADPAVYGFVDNYFFGQNYGTDTGYAGPEPFPNGAGRFAYIPSSGVFPAHNAGAVNGTLTQFPAKVVVVNIGGAGDLPAVGDYDGDGKADFAVYEPSKAQFLVYPSSTFNDNNDPTQNPGGLLVLPFGKVGDLPASADYQGVGRTQFAVYEPDLGRFLVHPEDGGAPIIASLGGPGFVPVSADFDGVGHAEFAVYSQARGIFEYLKSGSSTVQTIAVGSAGYLPAVGNYDGGTHAEFATFDTATGVFTIRSTSGAITTRALPDPNTIPVPRMEDFGVAEFQTQLAQIAEYRPDVLFLGDSIAEKFLTNGAAVWQNRINQYYAYDAGSIGDTTQMLLWRIENGILATQPKVVVVTIGTNDLFTWGRSASDIADTIRTIVAQIHLRDPNGSILWEDTIPPEAEAAGDPPLIQARYAYVLPQLEELDDDYLPAIIPPYNTRTTFGYLHGDYSINLNTQLNTNAYDGTNYNGNPYFYADGLHPNVFGYEVIANNLATPIRLLLNKPIVPSDFDGDGKTDVAVYAPNLRAFGILNSATGENQFIPYGIAGAGQDLIATGDYDGDGKSDYAVYGPSVGGFAIHLSASSSNVFIPYGIKGQGQSIPAPGDYDGDGITDIAVYDTVAGVFAVHNSKNNTDTYTQFGIPGMGNSIPAPGDYDGDGRTDLAVYLPSIGAFAIRPSSGGPDRIIPFGIPGAGNSIPVPGDYDGDGRTDLAVYLPTLGMLAYRPSSGGADVLIPWGIPGAGNAIPAPGDYDGDGKTDVAVYGPTVGGIAIHESKTGTNVYVPYGVVGEGQSLPTTSFITTT